MNACWRWRARRIRGWSVLTHPPQAAISSTRISTCYGPRGRERHLAGGERSRAADEVPLCEVDAELAQRAERRSILDAFGDPLLAQAVGKADDALDHGPGARI